MSQQDLHLSHYASFEQGRAGKDPHWLGPLRRRALDRFGSLGFPTLRHEDWKYTSVAAISGGEFHPFTGQRPETDVEALGYGDWPCARLVFVNGRFAPESSSVKGLPGGVRAGSLAAMLDSDPDELEGHLGHYAAFEEQAFTALNTAFLEDGAFLSIPEGVHVELPIHLLFVSSTNGRPFVAHPRNLILVGKGSQVTLYESYLSSAGGAYWTNAVTEIVGAEGARIEHIRVQREGALGHHVATVQTQLGRDAGYTSHAVSMGGALVRNDLNVILADQGGECTLNGLYLAGGKEHVDNHTLVDHTQPHASSRELYKGILTDEAHGVFNGRIIVREDAQKTDSRQTNKNLLLSRNALVDTKPQLEIFANDVKCAHGATVGQLDRDAMFYLQTRGIGEEEARHMLVHAFASELVDIIPAEPVRAALTAALVDRLSLSEAAA